MNRDILNYRGILQKIKDTSELRIKKIMNSDAENADFR